MGATLKDLKNLLDSCKDLPDSTELLTLNDYGEEGVWDVSVGDLDLNNDGNIQQYIIIHT